MQQKVKILAASVISMYPDLKQFLDCYCFELCCLFNSQYEVKVVILKKRQTYYRDMLTVCDCFSEG